MDSFSALLQAQTQVKVIDARNFVPIDLSESSALLRGLDLTDAAAFQTMIKQQLAGADAAFGGYNEPRAIYRRSMLFDDGRNIHLGIDLWTDAGTTVYAALDGTVHSFDYNAGVGDYGPTIILEHRLESETFYTLYGHLSVESIADLEMGQYFAKGAPLAALGTPDVNGDYAPHLHFQIIRDLGDHHGDYPGVCHPDDLAHFLANCPDPNLLLKLNKI